jgi:hypothetical protein
MSGIRAPSIADLGVISRIRADANFQSGSLFKTTGQATLREFVPEQKTRSSGTRKAKKELAGARQYEA